jgi:hypothetical protein
VTDDTSLPRALVVTARAQAGYVSAGQCDRSGVGHPWRRHLVGTGLWERPLRGVFDTGIVGRDLRDMHPYDQHRLRAVWRGLVAYANSAALGASALVLHGVRGLPREITVEVALPGGHHARSRGGIRVRQTEMRGMVTRIGEAPVAVLHLALVQALGTLDRDSWVACANDALRRGLTTREELTGAFGTARGRRGVREKRHWLDLTDERLESPLECRGWLALWDVGLQPDELQREIWSAEGAFLGRADMAWYLGEGRWLLVEIDGNEYHSGDTQLSADALRQNRLLKEGKHILLRFRAAHLYRPDLFVEEISAVLRREGWEPGRNLPADLPAPRARMT